MKIAFDSKRLFNNPTGLGNYSRTLVSNFTKFIQGVEVYLCTPKIKKNKLNESFLINNKYNFIVNSTKKPFWRSYFVKNELKYNKIDLYHGLSNEIPLNIDKKHTKTVVTIHDLIFKIYPSTYKPMDRWIYNFKFRYACKNADKIIAISEATKNDIIKFYNIPEHKIEVIYQACLDVFYQQNNDESVLKSFNNLNLPQNYMVYVGSVIPRKNVLELLKAYLLIPEDKKIPLVIVGKGGDYYQKCLRFVEENQIQNRVIFKNNIQDNSVLKLIYQNASFSIYPSVYEGFGLPVVESLLCGTPVITSNVSSMPEAGGNGALYCTPNDIPALSLQMQKLLTDENLRNELVINGRSYIEQKFNPKILSEQLHNVYQKLFNR